MKKKNNNSPLIEQYQNIKTKFSDALLLFQVGDFYELFFDDAKQAAQFLGIALTARGKSKENPIPLCGVPVHARDHYIDKLIKGGFKVAICDQLELPKPGTIVKRGVTQVLTPGTLTDTKFLDEKSASYLFSFFPAADQWGLLFGELLTAQLFATVVSVTSEKMLETELTRFFPDEILIPADKRGKKYQAYFRRKGYFTTLFSPHETTEKKEVDDWLSDQFRKTVTDTLQKQQALYWAVYYFYAYVRRNQKEALGQFHTMHLYKIDDFLLLDSATQRNLELVRNMQDGGRKNTLFSVMDGAQTAMGSRMIKKWILRPLIKKEGIEQRQEVVSFFVRNLSCMQKVKNLLHHIGDIERIVGRIGLKRAQIHDYKVLADSLAVVPKMQLFLKKYLSIFLFRVIHEHIVDFSLLVTLLKNALNDDTNKDWLIKDGFDDQIDKLRALIYHTNEKILALEQKEKNKTGIQSLKIRYNQVQGYFIEVTKTNLHLVPDYYQPRQTLVGKKRFVIIQLQQLQHEIEQAKGKIDSIEKAVFDRVKEQVFSYIMPLRKSAYALAHLDALVGLGTVAYNNSYKRPECNDQRNIIIEDGYHPVVEAVLDHRFITNDTILNGEQSLWIITGPNMGGKSTYLRQVALICIMTHVGSFVPAKKADIALLDRIFTRIGAGDNLAEGKSTFLIEMEETATICAQATKNSLIILDEVGRGTSTFDGLAIAQAVVEYLYSRVKARCLFATHYHELTQLQEQYTGIVSYYAASKKTDQGIVFLYKIIRGVADGSFGIEVAQLAQLPPAIIDRSRLLVHNFAAISDENPSKNLNGEVLSKGSYDQLACENQYMRKKIAQLQKQVEEKENIIGAFQAIDYDNLSPKQAFDLLWKLKEGS